MAGAREKKARRKKPGIESDDASIELVISYPNLRFSRERIEMLRDEKPVTTIDRKVVTGIVIKRGSPSEHPLRETLWGVGLGLAGAFVLVEAAESGKTFSWLIGIGLLLVAALVAKHLLGSVTIIELKGDWISSAVNIGQSVPERENARLNQRLKEELGWPVRS